MKQLRNIMVFVFFSCALVASPVSQAADILHTDIVGLPGAALKNAQDRLLIAQSEYGAHLTPAAIKRFYKNAPKNIKAAIEPYGYFKAEVYPSLYHQGDQWTARFVIEPGPPIRIAHVDIQIHGPGAEDAALHNALINFPIKAGQVFEAAKYDQAKEALFQTANEQGYLKASFETKTVKINMENYNAVVIVHLDTGPRFYFGRITFQQNTFSEAFLQRFLSFKSGEPFSSPKLIKFQQNLSNSNYFQEINVNPELNDTTNNQVPIIIGLTPTKARQYSIGVGYGTFTGVRASLGANFRHLTKTGHRVDLQVKGSAILSGLAAQYIIPGANPLTDQYTIGANIQRFLPKNDGSDSRSVWVGFTKTNGDWKWAPTLTYLSEHYNIAGKPSHNSQIVYPSFNVTHTHADDLIDTRYGSKIDLTLRGASTAVISNVTFLQSDLKGKYIFSPTELSRVLLRGEFGYTTVRDVNLLPVSLQFYAGGLDSVRGFPTTYFGPGRYLKTGSIELQHRLFGKLSGAIFYDIGTADNHINAAMGYGRGVGLIYATPIGPIKGYIGYGKLQGKPEHFDFEFSLGPDL
ncbi:MAG: BamA/TamA family outer membrane protein [Pseudomonadota bacterium]